MNKVNFSIVALMVVTFSGVVSAGSLKVSGKTYPPMHESTSYVGTASTAGSVETVLGKSAKVRLPNGTWQNLSSSAGGNTVSTTVTFKSTYRHTVSLYLKLREKVIEINEKGKPQAFYFDNEYSGTKAVDPCNKSSECVGYN